MHIDYGVGRYRGMTFLDVEHEGGEFMELEYADGAKLYIPSYRLSMVQKYTGGEATAPRSIVWGSGMGAYEGASKRPCWPWPQTWYRSMRRVILAMLFPRRQGCIASSKAALSTSKPRTNCGRFRRYSWTWSALAPWNGWCGDVGYGKTEVAMRAAFKAVYDNKQVAVLVPTTVLAQQHYDTFQRRFAPYAVHIGLLSRLRPQRPTTDTGGLRQGTVDIVIGTHRLLQKDVQFKNLGLLVVDEEHRLGSPIKKKSNASASKSMS